MRELPALGLRHTALDDALDGAELAVIVTAHPSVDHAAVARAAPATVDFRGVIRRLRDVPVATVATA